MAKKSKKSKKSEKVKFADGLNAILEGDDYDGEEDEEDEEDEDEDEDEDEEKSDIEPADELAVVEMRLSQVRNGDKKMSDESVAKLHAKARKLQRKGRLERLKKEMARIRSGEADHSIGIY